MNLTVQPCMPADVANILLFLASDESCAITGQVIVAALQILVLHYKKKYVKHF